MRVMVSARPGVPRKIHLGTNAELLFESEDLLVEAHRTIQVPHDEVDVRQSFGGHHGLTVRRPSRPTVTLKLNHYRAGWEALGKRTKTVEAAIVSTTVARMPV